MATTIQPIDHPAAWKATEFASKKDLTVELKDRHLSALATGLAALKSVTCEYAEVNSACFPLEGILEDVAAWREEVQRGRGLVDGIAQARAAAQAMTENLRAHLEVVDFNLVHLAHVHVATGRV